jgi:hypothetical protein
MLDSGQCVDVCRIENVVRSHETEHDYKILPVFQYLYYIRTDSNGFLDCCSEGAFPGSDGVCENLERQLFYLEKRDDGIHVAREYDSRVGYLLIPSAIPTKDSGNHLNFAEYLLKGQFTDLEFRVPAGQPIEQDSVLNDIKRDEARALELLASCCKENYEYSFQSFPCKSILEEYQTIMDEIPVVDPEKPIVDPGVPAVEPGVPVVVPGDPIVVPVPVEPLKPPIKEDDNTPVNITTGVVIAVFVAAVLAGVFAGIFASKTTKAVALNAHPTPNEAGPQNNIDDGENCAV